MRTIALITGLILCLSIAYGAHFITQRLPERAATQALNALHSMGFKQASITNADARIHAARFEKIKLDADGISTIERIEIRYSPLSMLLNQRPDYVKISGLTLIGNLSPASEVSIAGWDAASAKLNLQNGDLRTLVIEKGRLSLLTENLGGMNVDFDIQTRTKDHQVELQGHVKSRQKHLSMIAGAKGFINQNGLWQAELDITQGKLDISPVKATRVNGTLKITGEPGKAPILISELQAGGVSLYDYPWQNASATFEGHLESYKLFTSMRSVGHTGLELGLTFQNQPESASINGQIHSENKDVLSKYLLEHSTDPAFNAEILEQFGEVDTLSLSIDPNTEQVTFKQGRAEVSLAL